MKLSDIVEDALIAFGCYLIARFATRAVLDFMEKMNTEEHPTIPVKKA